MKIASRFKSNLNGWTASNGTESFLGGDGMPPGSIGASEDGSGVYGFVAPNRYLGDKEAFFGGALAFDLKQPGDASQFDDSDVILTSGEMTIVIDAGDNPGTDWTSYEVSLDLGAGWKVGSLSGRIATEAEIRAVLSDLQSLEIRGEFVTGSTDDKSALDNVVLSDAPASAPLVKPARVISTFDDDRQGWSFIEDVAEFRHVDAGGNPGGFLEAVDYASGQVWNFSAPGAYLGDKSAYSGGRLSFDLKQSTTTSQFEAEDVRLVGKSMTLSVDTAQNPETDWTHYAVTLDTRTDWRIGDLNGVLATQAQIDAVLGDLRALYIRGEFVTGGDTGGIDNVILAAPKANIRVLDNPVTGGLLSNHNGLKGALKAADKGNAIVIDNDKGASGKSYKVVTNDLTILSDEGTKTTFRLKKAKDIDLAGDNKMSAVGNGKDNRLDGSDGRNVLKGKGGDDTLSGEGGKDKLLGAGGADALDGGKGNDRLKGGAGKDQLKGGNGNDILLGGGGNDKLLGGKGSDTLNGGAGRDVLTGGGGADAFVLTDTKKRDVVRDFRDGTDLFEVAGMTAQSDIDAVQKGRNVLLSVEDVTALIRNTDASQIDSSDFIF